MPARTNGASVAAVAAVPAKKFELPKLEFKFGSLTEGTDIPPPLPSPIAEEMPSPPKTPTDEKKASDLSAAVNGHGKPSPSSPGSNITKVTAGGTKRHAEDNPASPTLSNRPGSIRRLFSRNLLNNAYEEGAAAAATNGAERPDSRTSSYLDPKKSKRSSGWFSRLRSADGTTKRSSMIVTPVTLSEKPAVVGPPPPMIPELNELKSKLDVEDEGSLGNDLFKDIKIDRTF